MPTTDERTVALCREIAERLRAVAADESEDLTPAERRELVEVGAVGLARRVYAAEIARVERRRLAQVRQAPRPEHAAHSGERMLRSSVVDLDPNVPREDAGQQEGEAGGEHQQGDASEKDRMTVQERCRVVQDAAGMDID